jgi:hypothetical protein
MNFLHVHRFRPGAERVNAGARGLKIWDGLSLFPTLGNEGLYQVGDYCLPF